MQKLWETFLKEVGQQDVDEVLNGINPKALGYNHIFGDASRLILDKEVPTDVNEYINSHLPSNTSSPFIDWYCKIDYNTKMATFTSTNQKGDEVERKVSIFKVYEHVEKLLSGLVELKQGVNKDSSKTVSYFETNLKKYFYYNVLEWPDAALASFLTKIQSNKKFLIDFYAKQSTQGADKYKIIVSRNPIDVLRMSDFAALRSCHAPGREYYRCAVNEARQEGLIAFLVLEKDLKEENVNDPEIFADHQRHVQGIEPVSRIRLRSFDVQPGNFKFFSASTRVYGKPNEIFKKIMQDWSIEVQPKQIEFLKDNNNRNTTVSLLSGHYSDGGDEHEALLRRLGISGSNFRETDNDDYFDQEDPEEDDDPDRFDEDDIRAINRITRNFDANHASLYAEVDGHGQEQYLSVNAKIWFDVKEINEQINAFLNDRSSGLRYEKERVLNRVLNDIVPFSVEEFEGSNHDSFTFYVSVDNVNDADDLDRLSDELLEFDNNYKNYLTDFLMGLQEAGVITKTERESFTIYDIPDDFENFSIVGESGKSIGNPSPLQTYKNKEPDTDDEVVLTFLHHFDHSFFESNFDDATAFFDEFINFEIPDEQLPLLESNLHKFEAKVVIVPSRNMGQTENKEIEYKVYVNFFLHSFNTLQQVVRFLNNVDQNFQEVRRYLDSKLRKLPRGLRESKKRKTQRRTILKIVLKG